MTSESVNNSIAEAETLSLQDQGETVDLKLCPACASEVRLRDRYCRRCGASQNLTASSPTEPLTESDASGASYVTAPLAALATENDVYHHVSGSLVKVITAGLSGSASARLDSRYARRAMLALISIPIWLLIAAAFAAGRLRDCQNGHPAALNLGQKNVGQKNRDLMRPRSYFSVPHFSVRSCFFTRPVSSAVPPRHHKFSRAQDYFPSL
jgi:hypothetical protein